MIRRFLFCLPVLALAAGSIAGCGDDDSKGPAGPGGSNATEFGVAIVANLLSVTEDCDAFSGDFSAEAGDFFISCELRSVVNGVSTVIESTDSRLFQVSGSGVITVDMTATGRVPVGPGATVEAQVGIYENDGGGLRQGEVTDVMTFAYDTESECWGYAGDDVCLRREGRITVGVVRVRDSSGDPCSADLSWSFDANPVP